MIFFENKIQKIPWDANVFGSKKTPEIAILKSTFCISGCFVN